MTILLTRIGKKNKIFDKTKVNIVKITKNQG